MTGSRCTAVNMLHNVRCELRDRHPKQHCHTTQLVVEWTDSDNQKRKLSKNIQITDPFIFRVLDISTSHMTAKDAVKLSDPERNMSAYELSEYGWLAYIGELEHNWPKGVMSAAFRLVLKVAKQMGCEWVRFDRDGREYPELKTFEW
jgi:hypothetical protein